MRFKELQWGKAVSLQNQVKGSVIILPTQIYTSTKYPNAPTLFSNNYCKIICKNTLIEWFTH